MTVLSSSRPVVRESRARVFAGRALTGLIVAFLLVDAVIKLIPLDVAVEGTLALGYPAHVIRPLGLVLCASTLLHVFPRTQLVGAVLLTAYLGAATAAHVRTGTPIWFSIAMGALLWIAYGLRTPQLVALLTPSSNSTQHTPNS